MGKLTKPEIMEKLLKLLQTDRDMSFMLSLDEKDLTPLLINDRAFGHDKNVLLLPRS
jgi:hypothetical protein